MRQRMFPNVVISKWTTRRGAGWQTEKEYVERTGKQWECNYFNKQSNIVPKRFRFKPKKTRVLPSSYSSLTTVRNSPVKRAKAKAKTATTPSRATKGSKKACKDIEERGLDQGHDHGNNFEGGATISGVEDVVMKTGEGVDDDDLAV